MKKITFFVLIFCLLLIVNTGHASDPNCWQSGNTATCTRTATDFNGKVATDDFYVDPSGGLDLNIYFSAYIPSSASGYLAYGTANWTTTGPTHYHHYGTGPYSGTIPYFSDANGWLIAGWMNLTAWAYGNGSYATVYAQW